MIEADEGLGEEVGVNGTPCSFVNGRRLTGARGFDDFASIIDEEIAHAKRLPAPGVKASRLYDHIIASGKLEPVAELKTVAAPGRDNPVRGGPGAKVTIQMFTDFECPYCGRVQETLKQVEKEYGSKVRFVYHHMPLDFHAHAMPAHEAAAEAFAQGGNRAFWKMHDLLFANQQALDHDSLIRYGKQAGLDVAKLDKALAANSHAAAIEKDRDIANKAGISGTPALVINGYFVSGAQPFAKFKRVIDRALTEAKSGKKTLRGTANR